MWAQAEFVEFSTLMAENLKKGKIHKIQIERVPLGWCVVGGEILPILFSSLPFFLLRLSIFALYFYRLKIPWRRRMLNEWNSIDKHSYERRRGEAKKYE